MARSDFHDINREKLVAFFKKGDKYNRTLGFELEHILLHADTGSAVSYSEPGGVRDVLVKLAEAYDKVLRDGDDIIGCENPGEVVTIEPAGQLEVSIGPCATVSEVARAYAGFRAKLNPVLDEFGLFTPLVGYNPASKVDDLELIPKYRYECMTRFLGAQAHEGICMMRGTASLQVSIDFRHEADALRKLRIAEIIAPLLALICDNSPIYEGEPYKGHMARTGVWAGMNQDRVGTVPGSLASDFSFADYAEYILSREAILVPDESTDNGWRYVAHQTFDEVYADRAMTPREVEHALSMVWPDARLKNFVEIRPADAMPIAYCLAYVALVRGLFYYDLSLEKLETMVAGIGENDVREAKEALMQKGYDAQVYGKSAAEWADEFMRIAADVLDYDERTFLEPLTTLVDSRTTLAAQALAEL